MVLNYAPPGQTIAVVRDSAHITLHSVQDGRVERCLSIPFRQSASQTTQTIAGVWWLAGHHSPASGIIPDIFKRNGVTVSFFFLANWGKTSVVV